MWELLSSLSSLAHVTGTVQAVFYGVPDPTGEVTRLLETRRTGGACGSRGTCVKVMGRAAALLYILGKTTFWL